MGDKNSTRVLILELQAPELRLMDQLDMEHIIRI